MNEQSSASWPDNTPEHISPTVQMDIANESISVYRGEFVLKKNGKEAVVNGSIEFTWYPSMGSRFSGVVKSDPAHIIQTNAFENFEIWADGFKSGFGYLTERTIGGDSIYGKCNEFVLGDRSVAVSNVNFSLPNFREFNAQLIKYTDQEKISLYTGRLVFDDGIYIINLDRRIDYSDLYKKLQTTGGYINLYGGCIGKKEGDISLKETRDLINSFNHFISFINGRRIALLFLEGIHDDIIRWKDCSPYSCEDFKLVSSWSQALDIKDLNGIWNSFSKLWKNENDRHFLISAIHWYVEANSATGYIDGSIILAQTALELIYNWLIVEQKKIIIGNDASNISAGNKIRLLLSQINVSCQIPNAFNNLKSIQNKGDGPEVFTWIRNCLVHGQEKKRRDLQAISVRAKFEALELGVWYIELLLLYIMDYSGPYYNRSLGSKWADVGQKVPWCKGSE